MARLNDAQGAYLDFMRAAAAMAVLLGHAATLFWADGRLARLDAQGVAVLVFFLLSGFLVSHSVFRKQADPHYGFRDYFIDRFCRIYCAFLPALAFVWIVDQQALTYPLDPAPERLAQLTSLQGLRDHAALHHWFGNLFMLQDFPLFQVARLAGLRDSPWFIAPPGSARPFWTISIEWWIYLSFGLIALVWLRRPAAFGWRRVIILGLVSIVPAYYLIGGRSNCLTLLWLTGSLAAWLFLRQPDASAAHRRPLGRIKLPFLFLMMAGGAVVLMSGRLVAIRLDTGAFAPLEFQFGLFLAVALFSPLFGLGAVGAVPAWLTKGCRRMANYSFSLYLTHSTVLSYLYVRFPGHDSGWEFFWAAVLACHAVALIFWVLFERHHLVLARSLKGWVRPRPRRRPALELGRAR